MTERGRGAVERDESGLRIGPSRLQWQGEVLTIDIDEVAVPWPARLRGRVRLQVPARDAAAVELAPSHRWIPIAPSARVEVDFGRQRWSGRAYLDSNQGDVPLAQGFRRWQWLRAHLGGGRSLVLFDLDPVGAPAQALGWRFDAAGAAQALTASDLPARSALAASGWRIGRSARADAGRPVRLRQTLTDAPFYARSLLEGEWLGEPALALHESLSLSRFESPWVQAMLPFRMPRSS